MKQNENKNKNPALYKEPRYNTPNSRPGVYAMTLCLAALCENREAIVCVADRLLTVTYPDKTTMHMEGQTKVYEPTPYFSILCSGNASVFSPLNDKVIEKMKEAQKTSIPSMMDTAQMAKESIVEIERDFNIDVKETAVILAGFDNSGGHLYIVSKTCSDPQDHAGFAAVGCGQDIADQKITSIGHDKTALVLSTIVKLFIAKKESESDPNVGKQTDVLVNIRGEQHAIRYADETGIIAILDEYYLNQKKKSSNQLYVQCQEALKPKLEHLFGITG